jgi:hypothetical protein
VIVVPNLLLHRFFFDSKWQPLFGVRAQLGLICLLEEIVVLFGMLGQVSSDLKDKVVRYLVLVGEIEETDRPLYVAIKPINDVGQDLV